MSSGGEPALPDPDHIRVRPFLDTPTGGAGEVPEPGGDGTSQPRPFILTSGRVRGVDPDIGLETQVSLRRPLPPWATPVTNLAPELQRILALCVVPLSVAEISAQVPLHLGVTKILVGDLRATGHLDVHAVDAANAHDPETILRVIRGLRALI